MNLAIRNFHPPQITLFLIIIKSAGCLIYIHHGPQSIRIVQSIIVYQGNFRVAPSVQAYANHGDDG
jgi:hypothetical protein